MRTHRMSPAKIRTLADEYLTQSDMKGSLPTINGMAKHLGVTQDTIRDWQHCKKKEYSDIACEIYRDIACYWEPLLGIPKNTAGAQYWMKFAMGWREDPKESKTEITANGDGRNIKVTIVRMDPTTGSETPA